MKFRWRKNRPRRHGLKLPGGYRCKCCYDELRGKAVERRMRDAEIEAQLDNWLLTKIHERLRQPPLPEAIRANVFINTGVECTVELDANDPHTVMVTYQRPPSIISFYGQVYAAAREVTPDYIRVKVNEAGMLLIDNTPLFEAMDKMSAEIPVEEWAEVPSFNGRFTESELQNWAEQLTQEMMSK